MGEVYRARDPKLGRDVAIKILPPHFTSDLERVARFEREARVLAALNHPHIGAIYGVEDVAGVLGLVLELVEGPSLADRLTRGRLPVDDALKIAQQISEALEAAHQRGIIHRDLKPANIGITPAGAVKVLDFGLAKGGVGEVSAAARDESPMLTITTAREGFLPGTAAYMSPEQARGKPLDKRSDIWAFGCVLYEMLTGHLAFEGETASDTIARVLECDPHWDALPANVPPAIQRLVRRCLKKDPSDRLHDIADARLEIVDALSAPGNPVRPTTTAISRERWLLITAAVTILAASVWLARVNRSPSSGPALLEFPINLPMSAGNAGFGLAVSPDGRHVAYATCCGGPQIWLHSLDAADTHPIPGTEAGTLPFWSPDSSNIGFFSGGKLMKVDLVGGPPVGIADLTGGRSGVRGTGGSWNSHGMIIFSEGAKLFRVSAGGGTPDALEVADDAGEGVRSYPQFLPDNIHFVYHVAGHTGGAIYLSSLDSPQVKHLLDSDYAAFFAAPSHLMYYRGTALVAQVLNLKTYNLEGPASLVASNAAPGYLCACPWAVFASASSNGVLAFVKTGGGSPGRLVWFDRTGKALSAVDQPEGVEYLNPTLSPDGEQIALNRMDPQTGNWDVWTVDVARGNASRVTFDPASDADPVWSPDSKEIVFASNRGGQLGLY
jgi:serine/threonine protein kinase